MQPIQNSIQSKTDLEPVNVLVRFFQTKHFLGRHRLYLAQKSYQGKINTPSQSAPTPIKILVYSRIFFNFLLKPSRQRLEAEFL